MKCELVCSGINDFFFRHENIALIRNRIGRYAVGYDRIWSSNGYDPLTRCNYVATVYYLIRGTCGDLVWQVGQLVSRNGTAVCSSMFLQRYNMCYQWFYFCLVVSEWWVSEVREFREFRTCVTKLTIIWTWLELRAEVIKVGSWEGFLRNDPMGDWFYLVFFALYFASYLTVIVMRVVVSHGLDDR